MRRRAHGPSIQACRLSLAACGRVQEKRLQLMNELRLLCDGSTAGVRGLIRYFGAYFSPESSAIKVALEYMDAGSLQSLLLRVGAFPEGILARIAADVLDGLAWLHSVKALVHRDIKPANILMNSAGEPKLSDFGNSTALDLDMAASTGGDALGRSVVQTIGRNGHSHHHAVAASSSAAPPSGRGTLYYMSPERLSSQPYGFSADIWSLGLTLLECATGIYPYATDTGPVSTMLEIMDCDPLTHHAGCAAQARARVSHSGQAFLRACLDRNPGGRPSASQARHAEWCSAAACSHAEVAAFLATPSSGVSGDAASQQMAYIQSLGQLFAAHYYCLLDAPRGDASSWHAQLGGIYAPHAHLTWLVDGHIPCQCAGPLDICAALAGARESSHHVGHLDCQPLLGRGASSGDGVLVHVTGTVVIAFEQFRFVEVFTLLPCAGGDPDTEGRWFVVNHWRREFAGA